MDFDVDYGKIDEFEDDIFTGDGYPDTQVFPEYERYYRSGNWDEDEYWTKYYNKKNLEKKFEIAVKLFYDKINKIYKTINYDEFKKKFRISGSNNSYSLYVKINNHEFLAERNFNDKRIWFYSLKELAKEYNKYWGSGGVKAIKKEFGLKYLDKKMAEGYEFENPIYLDDYYEDAQISTDVPELPYGKLPEGYEFTDPKQEEAVVSKKTGTKKPDTKKTEEELVSELPDTEIESPTKKTTKQQMAEIQKIELVGDFYDFIKSKTGVQVGENLNIFKAKQNNKSSPWRLYVTFRGRDQIMQKKDGSFYVLSTLEKKLGDGGKIFIRDIMGFKDYGKLPKKAAEELSIVKTKADELEKTLSKNTEEIELKDLTIVNEVIEKMETTFVEVSQVENTFSKDTTTEVQIKPTSVSTTTQTDFEHPSVSTTTQTDFEHPSVSTTTQTDIKLREMIALLNTGKSIKDELVNNLSKLTYIDNDIAKEKQKLAQIKEGSIDDEDLKETIEKRIKNLEEERSARLEAASTNKEALRSQFARIKDTIERVLKENTTLAERIKILFKEQGITIVSVLTAFGMIIGLIVETITGGGGATAVPSPGPIPSPSDKGGVKEWIKKQLTNLGKLLASLAEKAAAALPGIIGSIVSWLLNTAGKVVAYAANNLWVLDVFVGGLLLAEAKKYLK